MVIDATGAVSQTVHLHVQNGLRELLAELDRVSERHRAWLQKEWYRQIVDAVERAWRSRSRSEVTPNWPKVNVANTRLAIVATVSSECVELIDCVRLFGSATLGCDIVGENASSRF
jgi:hypothetical protein